MSHYIHLLQFFFLGLLGLSLVLGTIAPLLASKAVQEGVERWYRFRLMILIKRHKRGVVR